MYIFKDKNIAKMYNKVEMAKVIGVHPDTLRKVINQRQQCTKLIAYCITKFLDSEAEINDYFERV